MKGLIVNLILRRLVLFVVCITSLIILIYLMMVWNNNINETWPNRSEIREAYESSVLWLIDKRDMILKANNPVLWWMVKRSARLTGDDRLQKLFDSYFERYKNSKAGNYWYLLFNSNSWMPVQYDEIRLLSDYKQYLIYALTCDPDLARMQTISAQNDPLYCNDHPFRSSCVTHQMLGIYFLLERGCGSSGLLVSTMCALQLRARKQLVWDPRLIDQYLQRVLMLIETHATSMVKAVWVRRIINGRLNDGGWPGKRKILDLPGNKDLIYTRNFVGFGEEKSAFHATAQGLLIMANLMSNNVEVNMTDRIGCTKR